jgi:hypothetical protein
MAIHLTKMSEEESLIYNWQYGIDGHFAHSLMDAISKADKYNIEKLRKEYPFQVKAFERFSTEKGWFESIVERHR